MTFHISPLHALRAAGRAPCLWEVGVGLRTGTQPPVRYPTTQMSFLLNAKSRGAHDGQPGSGADSPFLLWSLQRMPGGDPRPEPGGWWTRLRRPPWPHKQRAATSCKALSPKSHSKHPSWV